MNIYPPNFLQRQAAQTAPTRRFFYANAQWNNAPLSLDVGCGPGIVTSELVLQAKHAAVIGLDCDPSLLATAATHLVAPSLHLLLADASALPLRSSCFSFILSHFTLMWVKRRRQALAEILRVLHSGGLFAAIEPDYTGRIEVPPPAGTQRSRTLPIIECLIRLGADPYVGSNLAWELDETGFRDVRFGTLAWIFNPSIAEEEIRAEDRLLRSHGIIWSPPRYTYTPIFWVLAGKGGQKREGKEGVKPL